MKFNNTLKFESPIIANSRIKEDNNAVLWIHDQYYPCRDDGPALIGDPIEGRNEIWVRRFACNENIQGHHYDTPRSWVVLLHNEHAPAISFMSKKMRYYKWGGLVDLGTPTDFCNPTVFGHQLTENNFLWCDDTSDRDREFYIKYGWYMNGIPHRLTGPAFEFHGKRKPEFWVFGNQVTPKEFSCLKNLSLRKFEIESKKRNREIKKTETITKLSDKLKEIDMSLITQKTLLDIYKQNIMARVHDQR